MKKILSAAMVLLFFTACTSSDPHQHFLEIRAEYLAGDAELTASVNVDYGDRCYDYCLSYIGDGNFGEVTVLKPEMISGIGVRLDEKKQILIKCDDVMIDTGVVYGGEVTPVGAIPLMVNALREGYVSDIYTDTDGDISYIVAEIDGTPAGDADEIIYTFWFAEDNKMLHKAEIREAGFVVISALFEEVQ